MKIGDKFGKNSVNNVPKVMITFGYTRLKDYFANDGNAI